MTSSHLRSPAVAAPEQRRSHKLALATSALIMVGLPSLALAQAAGNGIMAPFITWFQGSFALGIVVLAVLFCGVAFMAGVRNWMIFIGVAVGALVVSNASTIAGVLYTQNGG